MGLPIYERVYCKYFTLFHQLLPSYYYFYSINISNTVVLFHRPIFHVGEGELRGQPANPGSPRKMAVKTECV